MKKRNSRVRTRNGQRPVTTDASAPVSHVQTFQISDLRPPPENAVLYRNRTTADSDFARLVEGIRKDGVQAPLLVSIDRFVVSGRGRDWRTNTDSRGLGVRDEDILVRKSHRWQKVASVPQQQFEEFISSSKTEGHEITRLALFRSPRTSTRKRRLWRYASTRRLTLDNEL